MPVLASARLAHPARFAPGPARLRRSGGGLGKVPRSIGMQNNPDPNPADAPTGHRVDSPALGQQPRKTKLRRRSAAALAPPRPPGTETAARCWRLPAHPPGAGPRHTDTRRRARPGARTSPTRHPPGTLSPSASRRRRCVRGRNYDRGLPRRAASPTGPSGPTPPGYPPTLDTASVKMGGGPCLATIHALPVRGISRIVRNNILPSARQSHYCSAASALKTLRHIRDKMEMCHLSRNSTRRRVVAQRTCKLSVCYQSVRSSARFMVVTFVSRPFSGVSSEIRKACPF